MSSRWKLLSTVANQGATGPVYGQNLFETSGSFVVPAGVTSISVVAVGGGGGASASAGTSNESGAGGGGGGLGYVNNISVTPGETLTVTVGTGGAGGASGTASGANGGDTSLLRGSTVLVSGLGGNGGQSISGGGGGTGGSFTGDGGGTGGTGGDAQTNNGGGGGGGAGGYSGNGGDGGSGNSGIGTSGTGGAGGGGGGQSTGGTQNNGGGGVGLLGESTSGGGGGVDLPGNGGSILDNENGVPSGESGQAGGVGGLYGAGGGGAEDDTAAAGGDGGDGGLRIIYPGNLRSFPSTLTLDVDENGDPIIPPIGLGLSNSLLNITGTLDAWTTRTVDISAYAGATVRLVFKYVNTAGNFTCDFQIDNIQIDGNTYSFENTTHSFETSQVGNGTNQNYTAVAFTALTVTENLDGFWQVDSGGTPSNGTGRTDADDGNFYVYAETSAPANDPGFTFWLRSPQITLSANPTLQFAEARQSSNNDMGTLDVYLDIISV